LLILNFGLRRDFTWRFVIADISESIIGANFLFYGLLVDLRNYKLIDQITNMSTRGQCIRCNLPCVKTVTGLIIYHKLLEEFKDVTRPEGFYRKTKHNTRHHIETRPSVVCTSRRLAPERLTLAKNEFSKMLKNAIIRLSKSS